MKTVVTASNLKSGTQSYRHVRIITTLYDQDLDDIGLASISFDAFGSFSFAVQLRDVSSTLPKWCKIYDTFDVGVQWSKSIYNRMIALLIEKSSFSFEQYTRVNDFSDDSSIKEHNFDGWNAVLKSVEDFLISIDPEYRLFPY